MFELTVKQQVSIKQYVDGFKAFVKTDKGLEWSRDRKKKTELIQKLLSKERVSGLTEEEFSNVIKSLWATDFWRNKDYLIAKLLKDNTLQKLREELKELIHGIDPLEKRFDRFKENIKGLGPSSITEILLFASPDSYCLWNDKPKNILPFLKIDLLPESVYKYQIDGKDYVKCISVLSLIRDELKKSGVENADYIDVDFYFAFIFYEVYEKMPKPEAVEQIEEKVSKLHLPEIELPKIEVDKLSHSDVQGVLLELGNMLGYDTYVADPSKTYMNKPLGDSATLKEIPQFTYQRLLDTVKNIDVIWFEEEFPKFCFEIEHTTGVTLGLLRLYQIRKLTDAKFFVIAPEEIISKFQTEISKDPFHQIRERYIFRSYRQLADMFECALIYHTVKDKFFNIE
jgi:hypothetical protein